MDKSGNLHGQNVRDRQLRSALLVLVSYALYGRCKTTGLGPMAQAFVLLGHDFGGQLYKNEAPRDGRGCTIFV